MLWSTLDELDDLTSSTNSIMTLLSTLLVHPAIANVQLVEYYSAFAAIVIYHRLTLFT
jgi:hypothetical protein